MVRPGVTRWPSGLAITEIALVNDPPTHWLDSPTASVSVTKSRPDAIVAFCGVDAASADQAIVRDSATGGKDPRDFRIVIFEPTTK